MSRRPAGVPGENLGVHLEAQDEPLPDWMDARVGPATRRTRSTSSTGRRRFLIRQRSLTSTVLAKRSQLRLEGKKAA